MALNAWKSARAHRRDLMTASPGAHQEDLVIYNPRLDNLVCRHMLGGTTDESRRRSERNGDCGLERMHS